MSSTPPWALHYEPPGPAAGASGSSGSSRGSSAIGSHHPPRASVRQGGGAPNAAFVGDGHAGARQETAGGSDGEWKRPRTLAPPWAAGGGQAKFLKR